MHISIHHSRRHMHTIRQLLSIQNLLNLVCLAKYAVSIWIVVVVFVLVVVVAVIVNSYALLRIAANTSKTNTGNEVQHQQQQYSTLAVRHLHCFHFCNDLIGNDSPRYILYVFETAESKQFACDKKKYAKTTLRCKCESVEWTLQGAIVRNSTQQTMMNWCVRGKNVFLFCSLRFYSTKSICIMERLRKLVNWSDVFFLLFRCL